MTRFGTVAIFLSLAASALCVQETPCPVRSVAIGILDRNGNVPHDLSAAIFHAELNRKPLEITAARVYSGPKRVAILVDTSPSMKRSTYSAGKSRLAYRTAADAVKRLPKDFSIAFLTFDRQVDRLLDFSVPREQIAAELAEHEQQPDTLVKGKTALRDAVEYALDNMPNPTPGDAIYLITDGEDNSSRINSAELQQRLEYAGVRLYVFLLRDFLFTGDPLPGGDETATLARATGGTSVEVHPVLQGTGTSGTTEDFTLTPARQRIINEELSLLYRQLISPYLLDVRLPAVLNEPASWNLEVADRQLKRSLYLFYPRQIAPCQRQSEKR
jgi:hypothetical protein